MMENGCFMGMGFLFWNKEDVLNLDFNDSCHVSVNILKTIKFYTLNE